LSAKIEQIIEVIEEVRERINSSRDAHAVYRRRVEAIRSIAARREITPQAVNDKFIRKLRPDINSLPEFDDLLTDWFAQRSNKLQTILLNHASSDQDREFINNAFYIAPEPDILLAQEFGCDPNEQYFKEGKTQLRLHLSKERNRHLVTLAKESWRQSTNGKLRCAACDFSFPETYGQVGEGFIEAHHKAPIATLAADAVVRIADLAPVCSNCHSMLHRRRPWLTIEQLRDIVNQRIQSQPSVP
jgi:hypothetical protein